MFNLAEGREHDAREAAELVEVSTLDGWGLAKTARHGAAIYADELERPGTHTMVLCGSRKRKRGKMVFISRGSGTSAESRSPVATIQPYLICSPPYPPCQTVTIPSTGDAWHHRQHEPWRRRLRRNIVSYEIYVDDWANWR